MGQLTYFAAQKKLLCASFLYRNRYVLISCVVINEDTSPKACISCFEAFPRAFMLNM